MRSLYSLLLYLLLPAILLRLWWKGRHTAAYRRHWRERLAWDLPTGPVAIWLHAVSVGEVRAAQPLIQALQDRHPNQALLVTVTTPGGRHTVKQLFGDSVTCRYLPYDLPGAVHRFIAALKPARVVILEVELWPNLYAALADQGVPLYLVNARLSQRALRAYRYLRGLMRATLQQVCFVAAQTEADRQRLVDLGVHPDRIRVAGNLKYEAQLPQDFGRQVASIRRATGARRPAWLAASTHPGEDAIVLRVQLALQRRYPHALLLLAPRHPQRTAEIVRLCEQEGLSVALFSELPSPLEADVLVVDRLGVLVYCYGVVDVAFVGGSLVDLGGHNPVEALLAGVPVVSGPHVAHFIDLYGQLQAAGAAVAISGGSGLSTRLMAWLADPQQRARAVAAGQAVVRRNQGALSRIVAIVGNGDGGRATVD